LLKAQKKSGRNQGILAGGKTVMVAKGRFDLEGCYEAVGFKKE